MNIKIVTWNLENLFHPHSGGPRLDYTPEQGWTEELFHSKVERIGLAVNSIIRDHSWAPFIFGFTEVENPAVMQEVLKFLPPQYQVAQDPHFSYAYHDVVVVYDSASLDMLSCRHHQTFDRFEKGDLCQVDFAIKNSTEIITVFGCHLKARPSNAAYTAMYRQGVCDNLQTLIWKMHNGDKVADQALRAKTNEEKPNQLVLDKNIVLFGDFNDEPFSSSIIDYLGASYDKTHVQNQKNIRRVILYNCSWEGLREAKPGSYYYPAAPVSEWSMLDQIMVSPSLVMPKSKLKYVENSYKVLSKYSAKEDGTPFAVYSEDENEKVIWQPGYSDHFPVLAEIKLEVNNGR